MPSQREVRVVRVHGRGTRLLVIACLVVVGIAMLFSAYRYGLYRYGLVSGDTLELSTRIGEQQREIKRLKKDLVDAEVAARVDRATADELRASLEQMHDAQAHLNEEVTFYRSLMAPSSLERGLQIAELALLALDGSRAFRYELLLTQVEARRAVVQGSVTLDVVGERAGEQVVLPLTEIEPNTDYPLKYRFRYFQDFSGTMQIPEGFEPLRVVVTVTRQGSREANLQRTFDWLIEAS